MKLFYYLTHASKFPYYIVHKVILVWSEGWNRKIFGLCLSQKLLFNTLIRVRNNIAIGKGIDRGIYNIVITRWAKLYWHLFDCLSIYNESSCKPRVSVSNSSLMWTCHGCMSMLRRYGYNTIRIWWYGNS